MSMESTNTAAARRRAARAAERDQQAATTARLPHPEELSGPGSLTWTAPTGPPAVDQPGPATGYAGLAEPASLPPIVAHGPTAVRWAGDPDPAA